MCRRTFLWNTCCCIGLFWCVSMTVCGCVCVCKGSDNCEANCLWKCGPLFWQEARGRWSHTSVDNLCQTLQEWGMLLYYEIRLIICGKQQQAWLAECNSSQKLDRIQLKRLSIRLRIKKFCWKLKRQDKLLSNSSHWLVSLWMVNLLYSISEDLNDCCYV